MAKMVYVVKGDHDGIIGVMGNKKQAIKLGQAYCSDYLKSVQDLSINPLAIKVDDRQHCILVGDDVAIEKWRLGEFSSHCSFKD